MIPPPPPYASEPTPLKAFIFAFNDVMGTRDTVTAFLNTVPGVANWYAILPHAIFVISPWTASQLSAHVRERFAGCWFIVAEIKPETIDGWLPQANWDFINEPKPVSASLPLPPPPLKNIFTMAREAEAASRLADILRQHRPPKDDKKE